MRWEKISKGASYFLFQALDLDLPGLKVGQILTGHIVESKIGSYDSKNVIVNNATYKVLKIYLNMENVFFLELKIDF